MCSWHQCVECWTISQIHCSVFSTFPQGFEGILLWPISRPWILCFQGGLPGCFDEFSLFSLQHQRHTLSTTAGRLTQAPRSQARALLHKQTDLQRQHKHTPTGSHPFCRRSTDVLTHSDTSTRCTCAEKQRALPLTSTPTQADRPAETAQTHTWQAEQAWTR